MVLFLGIFLLMVLIISKSLFNKGVVFNKGESFTFNNLRSHFRIFDLFSWIILAVLWIYPYVYLVYYQYDEIDFYISLSVLPVIGIYSILFLFVFYKLIKSDLERAKVFFSEEEIMLRKPFLRFLMLSFLISSAMLSGIEFTHFTNMALDRSIPEDFICKVVRSVNDKTQGKNGPINSYKLYVAPDIYGKYFIIVDEKTQKEATKGDKVKVKVYKGFYGFKYLGQEYELIKKEK